MQVVGPGTELIVLGAVVPAEVLVEAGGPRVQPCLRVVGVFGAHGVGGQPVRLLGFDDVGQGGEQPVRGGSVVVGQFVADAPEDDGMTVRTITDLVLLLSFHSFVVTVTVADAAVTLLCRRYTPGPA